jgi:uncharacterized membrane protein
MVIQEYFVNPILQNGWFNPVNTAVYSILLIIGVWLVYRMLARMKVQIDMKFALAILPFIFWGSSTRVLHDAAVAEALPSALNAFYIMPFFPTPGSYLITFGLALAVLLASLLVQRHLRFPYWKAMLSAGTVLCIANIIMIPWVTVIPFALIIGLTAIWTALFYPPVRLMPQRFSLPNLGILSSHFLDASATFIALSMFGYVEQHVLPRMLIFDWGPISMFVLKAAVVVPVLLLIDHYTKEEDRNFRNFLKIVILILGLAPGLRDLLRLMAMV